MAVIKPKVADMRNMMMNYFWGKNTCLKSTLDREVDSALISQAMNEFHYISCVKDIHGEWVYSLKHDGKIYLTSINEITD